MKIKKGDNVEVMSGKDAGKRGRVLVVDRDRERVVVEGVNMIKRHTRPNPQKKIQGGIVEREAAIHASNVMPLDTDGIPTRIGRKKIEDPETGRSRWVRYAKTTGEELDR